MTLAAFELAGFAEDLTTILTKAPQYAGDIAKIVNQAGRYIPTIVRIVEDPAFPAVVARVQELRKLEEQRPSSGAAPASAAKGIGLQAAVAPLDIFIWTREHPVATAAIAVTSVLTVIGLGVVIGRATKRC